MFERVYRSEPVMAPVRRSEALVGELFDRYFASADMPGRWGEAARAARPTPSAPASSPTSSPA